MRATAQATVRPWAPQPLEQARATLQAVNLAALWPQAPTTDLHGTLTAGPDAGTDTSSSTQAPAQQGAWNLTADLSNRAPGPWDTQRLPLAGLQAQARYAAGGWTVNQATATVGRAPRAGSLDLQGSFAPATGAVARLDPPAQPVARRPALRTGGVAPVGQRAGPNAVAGQPTDQHSGALDGRHSISSAHGHRTGECDRPAH